jgi:hypothetical protein
MLSFLSELSVRNELLYYFGLINLVGAIISGTISIFHKPIVFGINAWIKPIKFFLSLWIYSWSVGWIFYDLNMPEKVRSFSIMVVGVLSFEQIYITIQAARGQKSHFNISSPFYGIMYTLMGLSIGVMTGWTAYLGLMFWYNDFPLLSTGYLWGVRLGIIGFVLFAFSGYIMGSRNTHTVGGPDGSPGLPFTNWSKVFGDLRVAHFLGMHALQVLPFLGFLLPDNSALVIAVGILYLLYVSIVLVQSLRGIPFFRAKA